jgi:hypothetical protein
MSGNVNYRIRLLFSTLALIEAENPVLLEGETWTEKDASTGQSTGRRKVGDGVTVFTSLPFEPGGSGGSGDVEGPASSVDGRAALFDGTTGKLLKQSAAAPVLEGDARLTDARTPTAHNQAASTISDSTTAGRALLTAADANAQRTALGLGTAATTAATDYAPAAQGVTNGNSHDHNGGDGAQIAYSSLSGLPTLGTAAATDSTAYAAALTTNASVTAGTNSQGQGPLTADLNIITSTPNNPSAVTLPTAAVNEAPVVIVNRGTNPVNVYPASGAQIDTAGANNPYSLAVGARFDVVASSSTQWQSSSVERTSVAFLAGTGTGVNTALAVNVGTAGAFVVLNGAGGTPSSLTLTNATGLPPGGLTMATARLLGRSTAGSGVAEEISIGTNLTLSGGVLNASGGGATNLSIANRGTTTLDVASDTGTDATIPAATTSLTGLLTSADKTKLDGIATGATANATDAALRDRATHTGTQGVATITGLGSLATLSALGNISSAGAIGSTATLPVITTTGGVLTTGTFGTAAGSFCQGNDSRLSDARTPLSHTHGNISNAGAIGSTANLPIITGTSGVLQAGSFGATANTFCQGNDSRLTTDLAYTASTRLLASSTGADVTLPLFGSTDAGLTPASGGGTSNFLRADGTWAAPAGGSATDLTYTASTRLLASSTGTDVTLPLVSTGDAGLAPASGGGTSNFLRADGTWAAPPGGGLTDGDKGDITVSGGGATWTIDNGAVTLAKMQDRATQRVIGRNSAGSGVPEEVSLSQLLDWASSTRGALVTRGASGWVGFAPPADNSVLNHPGGTADVQWLARSAIALTSAGLGQFAEASTAASDLRFILTAGAQTGNGALYFQNGNLGTPSGGTLTSCTGLPLSGLAQSSATTGQVPTWNGTTWAAQTPSGGGSLTVQDEGSNLSTSVTTINFTGSGVTATGTSTVTVNVPSGSASAGGSTTQVQYNNAGALAGAANVEIKSENLQLTAPGSTPGAADASSIIVYPVSKADRFMAAMRGPIGSACLLQPSLFSNDVMMFNPQSGTVGTGGNAFQTAWTSSGTVTHPAPSITTVYSRARRTNYNNVGTTTNQQLGVRMNTTSEMAYVMGNAAGVGGFFYFARFGIGAWPAATVRLFAGLQGNAATTSICTSDTVANNTVGLWHDTTDPSGGSGAFNLVTRNGSTTTKTPINLANNIASTTLYEWMMYCEPNGSEVFYRLDDLANGVSYTGSTTSTLPVNTVYMSPQCQMSNGTAHTTANSVVFAISKIYVEAPF